MNRLVLECEVHEVTSHDARPTVSLVTAGEWGRKAKGAQAIKTVATLAVDRKAAKWFGAHLYQTMRVIVEVAGPVSDAELAARDEWDREFELEWTREHGHQPTADDVDDPAQLELQALLSESVAEEKKA